MIPIDFDKPRNLKFDIPAIKDLEANMNGQPLGAIVGQLAQLGITALTTSLWCGLKHEDRTLTPNLVTKMLGRYIDDGKSLRVLARALNDAIEETGIFRNDDEETEGNATTAA